jgi:hypothetical protein
MGKRKVFVKTDLTTAVVEYTRDSGGNVVVLPERVPPPISVIRFGQNASDSRMFDFAPWYGVAIDQITYACHRQIERFIDKQDSDVEGATIVGYCRIGLRHFLDYAAMLAAAIRRPLHLGDITRDTIDGYLGFLRDKGFATGTQRTNYYLTKAVLSALGRRGLFTMVNTGHHATFPRNAFPNAHRAAIGEAPLSVIERKSFAMAVRSAVQPLFAQNTEPPTKKLLVNALLVIALHTGRNTTPLLEMSIDCLRPHPKDGTEFLVLQKRRGHTSSKVILRSESTVDRVIESMPTVRPTVGRLIRLVIELTRNLREEARPAIRNYVWLYRSKRTDAPGQVTALDNKRLAEGITKLVEAYALKDADGKPMRINVSRLRKTFVNRVNEILGGDLVATAAAAGNQPQNTDKHYLRPGEDAQRNWRFMGICLVQELLTGSLGATERTPIGRCSDNKAGEYAPKCGGAVCQSFLNCLRCRNYVVTGDDLWRLFSFYWRVLRERPRVDKRRWDRHLSHIPRLIDRDVVKAGISRKVFSQAQVDAARERARRDPHPFWASHTIISELEALT